MADTRAVWGVDIGQAGLKALKVQYSEATQQAVAVAFDYVAHPKILSQPDAVPEELIPQALETFLGRNEIGRDLVSISVPGKSSLARFVSLPPVEAGKVAEIVKFEAKQQIPFPLEEVIWDWQALGEADEASGFMLDAEVGLFAMKRAEVLKAIEPFSERKVEIEVIQTAPVALYNALLYDELGFRGGDSPPGGEDYYVVLDMGCDDTTLVITNGEKIWIRTVNIGGNHFTRALVKEMKLSFAKAEQLKCNATKAEDPKSIFQALRPVFNDYVAEIKRSIGFFTGVNRQANITKVFGLGNGFKLAGLQKYLQQNLEYEVVKPDGFQGLTGDAVLNSPLFQENLLSFPVAYGLAVQTLGSGRLETTLLPPEIALDRKIRQKKPWAVASAAALLLAFASSMALAGRAYETVKEGEDGKWADAEKAAAAYATEFNAKQSAYTSEEGRFNTAKETVKTLIEGRRDLSWLELLNAVNAALPRDAAGVGEDLHLKDREALSITSITSKHVSDVGPWFTGVPDRWKAYVPQKLQEKPPSGEGYVFTITGKSWHHDETDSYRQDVSYVMETLVKNLREWQIEREGRVYDVRRMGISHPAVVSAVGKDILYNPEGKKPKSEANSRFAGRSQGVPAGPKPGEQPKGDTVKEIDFRVQFAWVPTPPGERAEADPDADVVDAAPAADPTQASADAAPPAAADSGTPPATGGQPGMNGPAAPGGATGGTPPAGAPPSGPPAGAPPAGQPPTAGPPPGGGPAAGPPAAGQ